MQTFYLLGLIYNNRISIKFIYFNAEKLLSWFTRCDRKYNNNIVHAPLGIYKCLVWEYIFIACILSIYFPFKYLCHNCTFVSRTAWSTIL